MFNYMAKFIEKIKNAGLDKWLHIVAAFCVVAIVGLIFKGAMEETNIICATCGAIAGIVVGLAKELIDFFRGGKFDAYDLIADAIGIVLGFGCCLLM